MFANCYKDEKCYSLHGTLGELPLSAYVPSATAPHLLTWDTLYNRNSCSLPTDCPQPERDVRVRNPRSEASVQIPHLIVFQNYVPIGTASNPP